MPGSSSKPEKYSIDEIMDRLKVSSPENPENGERVIRADGTEAIKVRKRKRRSDQTERTTDSATRRARIIQVSGALILLILAILATGTGIIFANSLPFRESLLRKISQFSGAKADISRFRMNPKAAIASELTLKWPPGNLIKSLQLNELNASIIPVSFLAKTMAGEEVAIADASLTLQIPQANEKSRLDPAPVGTTPIDFKRFRANRFELIMGNPNAPAFSLKKSEASFYPAPNNSHIQLSLNHGDLAINGWPTFRIDRAFMEFRDKEVEVVSLRIVGEEPNRGTLELSGKLEPYAPERPSTLNVEFKNFPLAGIVGKPMANLLSGNIDSIPATNSNYFSFYPSDKADPKLAAACQSALTSNLELSGFSFLSSLAQTLEDKWFVRPVFTGQETRFNLSRAAGGVRIEEIEFANKGRMALRGQVEIDAKGGLTGELEVGIADGMINASRSEKAKTVFSPSRSGYRWLTLKIGGQVADPTDNFNQIMIAGVPHPATESPPIDTPKSTFEELTKPR